MHHDAIPQWKAPSCDVYKINWDIAINKSKKLMGMGVIVRDCNGQAQADLQSSRMFIMDPTTAEAYAAWQAMVFGRDLGLYKVQLERDALAIVQVLQNDDPI
ncbi:hypothetical protein SLA2020_266820 [Shorea laevis]